MNICALQGLNDEVGERRAVGRASRARSANQGNLRHRSREHDVVVKDAAVAGQAVNAFLHARAAGIIDEDERAAGLEREAHHVGNLVAVNLAGSAARHGEILAGQMHQAAIDRGASGHHAIGGHLFVRPCRNRWRGAAQTVRSPESCLCRPAVRRAPAPSACRRHVACRCAPCRRRVRPRRAWREASATLSAIVFCLRTRCLLCHPCS